MKTEQNQQLLASVINLTSLIERGIDDETSDGITAVINSIWGFRKNYTPALLMK